MHPWIPVLVSIFVALFGIGGNLAVVAFFLGKLRAEQTGNAALVAAFQSFTKDTIAALVARMHTFDEFASESSHDRATLAGRLLAVEKNTEGLPKHREDFIEHRTECRAAEKRTEAELSRMSNAVESVQRQIANLAMRGAPSDVVELPKAKV